MSLSASLFSKLCAIRHEFITKRVLWIPGNESMSLLLSDRLQWFLIELTVLKVCGALGASLLDMEAAKRVSDSLRTDPTLPFRRTKGGRFELDFTSRQIRRLEPQPFILTVEEDFVRHDSGQVRKFEDIDRPLQYNSLLHALFRFKAFMIDGVNVASRPGLDYTSPSSVCTLFHVRTVTEASKNLLGQPALEGVHADGIDFTMTTLLGHQNMRGDSAETFIHSPAERSGIAWNETDPNLCLGKFQHVDFLDTLFFVDHERKHSVSPVWPIEESKPALRDMLVFFTRKPVVKGHVSFPYDSFREHRELPLAVRMAGGVHSELEPPVPWDHSLQA